MDSWKPHGESFCLILSSHFEYSNLKDLNVNTEIPQVTWDFHYAYNYFESGLTFFSQSRKTNEHISCDPRFFTCDFVSNMWSHEKDVKVHFTMLFPEIAC